VANLLFEPVSADAAWLKFAARCSELGTPCVRVVPVRGEGALIVAADASAGTLGAAALDAGAIERARALLAGGGAAHLADVADGATARTCLIDPLRAEGPRVWLFGAGHVGRALVNVLAPAAGSITWIDERDDEFPRQLPSNVRKIVTDTPVAEVAAAPVASFFLVMTHNHALDEELAEAILKRGDFAYFGLIGSATKRRRFEQRLSARGMDAARLAAMICPIGAAGIGDKRPAAIAIAAAAELLHRYESRRQDSAQPQQARSA
jgi:xanthine dehydrogenase accessory factor